MLKNNLKAMAIHLIISVAVIVLTIAYVLADNEFGLVEYEDIFMQVLAGVAVLGYVLASNSVLTDLRSVFKNIISVSAVSIIGVCVWLVSYLLVSQPYGGELGWGAYMAYNSAIVPLSLFFPDQIINITFLVAAFMPSVLLFLGILFKKST